MYGLSTMSGYEIESHTFCAYSNVTQLNTGIESPNTQAVHLVGIRFRASGAGPSQKREARASNSVKQVLTDVQCTRVYSPGRNVFEKH